MTASAASPTFLRARRSGPPGSSPSPSPVLPVPRWRAASTIRSPRCSAALSRGSSLAPADAASRKRLDPGRWIPATAIGMGIGLLLGAATVDYGTSLGELALMGALTGVVLGVAQAVAPLPRHTPMGWAWAVAMPVLWALGWTPPHLVGSAWNNQFTIFGAYGAVTFSALSGLLLHYLLPYRAEAGPGFDLDTHRVQGMSAPGSLAHGIDKAGLSAI